jgi:hypothetical protein
MQESDGLFYVLKCIQLSFNVEWVPCQHGMARPQVADGGDGLQIWRVAANILNKQSRTAERVWPSTFEDDESTNKYYHVTKRYTGHGTWVDYLECSKQRKVYT